MFKVQGLYMKFLALKQMTTETVELCELSFDTNCCLLFVLFLFVEKKSFHPLTAENFLKITKFNEKKRIC